MVVTSTWVFVVVLLEFKLVVLAGLQAAFTGEMRIFLADIVEGARQQNGRQAAEHHGRQHLGEQIALRLVKDLRIADGQRDRAFADAAGHDRDDDEEERVVGAKTQQNADDRADDAADDGSGGQAARIS